LLKADAANECANSPSVRGSYICVPVLKPHGFSNSPPTSLTKILRASATAGADRAGAKGSQGFGGRPPHLRTRQPGGQTPSGAGNWESRPSFLEFLE